MMVPIEDLRRLTERLIAHLEARGIEAVELPYDYYWDVPEDARYDPYQEPSDLVLGQLTDDWRELAKLLEGSNEPMSYHLVWLAAVLRAVGETLVAP